MDHGVGHEGLGGHESGESVQIYGVDVSIDDEVAGDSEEDEDVNTSVKKRRRQDAGGEAAKARSGERAGSHEQKATVVFGLGAPVDAEREGRGETNHVEQRNDEEGFCARLVKLDGVEMSHSDGGGDAHTGDGEAESYAEPANLLMDADVARADEQGLKNIKDQPTGENKRVEIKDGRARRRRVDEIFVHCVTEAVNYGRRDEQRHEEIKIIVERCGGSCCGFRERSRGNVNRL